MDGWGGGGGGRWAYYNNVFACLTVAVQLLNTTCIPSNSSNIGSGALFVSFPQQESDLLTD